MSKLRSEVLFNRGLLWLVIGHATILERADRWLVLASMALAILSFAKSLRIWTEAGE